LYITVLCVGSLGAGCRILGEISY